MENKTLPEIAQRRADLLARLSDAADPPPVLVAVSKRQPEERLEAALAAGQRVFGENRVQEAEAHWTGRRGRFPDLELHLIGPLQTNKADEAVTLFDVIETLDRPKLARALAKSIEKLGRTPRLLIQVNTGQEPQKAGVAPDELAGLLAMAREECGLEISGLMCIPPAEEPAAPHFALLKRLAEQHALSTISMGMSGDFELAARLGATHVRVGTGFFGAREPG
jgi:pyridoxal phosphate enzyme (YggS family)